MLSIDIKLQKLVEDLYGDRRGALVAHRPARPARCWPSSASRPSTPTCSSTASTARTGQALNESIDKPLLNRALRGTYPPGSTYKPFMALAALETGKRTPQQAINDPGYFMVRRPPLPRRQGRRPRHGRHVQVDRAVVRHLLLHAGQRHGRGRDPRLHEAASASASSPASTSQGESRGLLPSTEWKRKRLHASPSSRSGTPARPSRWASARATTTSPCCSWRTAMATLANNGVQHEAAPGAARSMDIVTHAAAARPCTRPWASRIAKPENIAVIRKALVGVNIEGTSAARVPRRAATPAAARPAPRRWSAIKQNEKYNASQLDERHRDHALFIAFAPADDPKIAIAMIVENAGFGAAAAAPIARRAFDYWLMGQYPSEEDMAAVQQGQGHGADRQAAQGGRGGLAAGRRGRRRRGSGCSTGCVRCRALQPLQTSLRRQDRPRSRSPRAPHRLPSPPRSPKARHRLRPSPRSRQGRGISRTGGEEGSAPASAAGGPRTAAAAPAACRCKGAVAEKKPRARCVGLGVRRPAAARAAPFIASRPAPRRTAPTACRRT